MKPLTLFLLALTFASQGWGQGIQFDRINPKGVYSVPPSPVFTNTQVNEYFTSLLNGLSITTEFGATQGANFTTDAVAGGAISPIGATVHQVNGLAGYVQNNTSGSGSAGNSVGVYGQARCVVNNSFCWGGNFLAQSAASLTGVNLQGVEIDCNAHTNDVVWCISITGQSAGSTPTNSIGLYIRPMGLTAAVPWQNGILFQDAASAAGGAAIYIGPVGTGNSVSSQNLILAGRDAGGIVRQSTLTVDLNGNFVFNPTNSKGVLSPVFGSTSANPSASGQVRLSHTDAIGWRNNGNTNDVTIGVNSSDRLTLGSSVLGLIFTGTVAGSTSALSAGTCGDAVSATITGAVVGNAVTVTPPTAGLNSGLIIDTGHTTVTATNTVQTGYCNITTGSITPSAATLNITVVQ